MVTLSDCLIVSALLFALGIAGVALRRNVLVMLMSLEMCLNAANLTAVSLSRFEPAHTLDGAPPGLVFTLFVIAIAAAEVAVGLALVIALYRTKRNTSVRSLTELHS